MCPVKSYSKSFWSSSASTCSAFEQLRPLQSVQAVVHWRPCFQQEQRRLSQLDLHLQRMTFINSSGAAGRQVFTGTNLPFDIVHPQSRGSNCKSSSRFVHSMTW